jgi:hypothetical protein
MRASYNLFVLSFVIILIACTTPVSQTGQAPTPMLPTPTMVNARSAATPFKVTTVIMTSSTPPVGPDSTEIPSTPTIIVFPSLPRPTLQMQVKDLRQEGYYFKGMVCFDVPDGADWMIDHASLQYSGGETSFESAETLESQPPLADGTQGYRCQEISFMIPAQANLSNATLTIQGLRASLGEGEFCERYLNEAQSTLTARQTGIEIGCTQSGNGFNLTVNAKPDSLSLEEAQRIIYDFYTIPGPWTFLFSNPPVFIFKPLVYNVKAAASNFRREGELIKVDVCVQIDNTDWEAWLVKEGILEYAGLEDRYFGTSAQLQRVSPANAWTGKYCGILGGSPNLGEIPVNAKASDFILTINSLVPDVNISNLCTIYLEHVQQRLDEKGIGIRAQCGRIASGGYALKPVDLPVSIGLSRAAVERVLSNVGLFFTLQGPWRLDLK